MMKKILLVLWIVLGFINMSFLLYSNSNLIIENPYFPDKSIDSKKAGRVIKTIEIFRISDADGAFFLKSPGRIKVSNKNYFYIYDQNHLLKFNKQGKFLKKILKQGEGPGELKYFGGYHLSAKELTVGTIFPTKIIRLNHSGELISDFRVDTNEFITVYLAQFEQRYYFRSRVPKFKKNSNKSTVVEANNNLFYSDKKGKIFKMGITFPTKEAIIIKNRNRTQMPITRFLVANEDNRYLYISCDERYLVYHLDLKKNKIVKKFRRQYKQLPFIPKKIEKNDKRARLSDVYKKKYFNDIFGLFAVDNNVWVLTSTIDKKKGILIDVFNTSGKYIDNFYLKIPKVSHQNDLKRKQMAIHDGFLYTIENDEEDSPYIVKYKLKTFI